MSDVEDWDDNKKMTMAGSIIKMINGERKLWFRVRAQDGELYYGQFCEDETFVGDMDEGGNILFVGVHELIGPANSDVLIDDNIVPFPKK